MDRGTASDWGTEKADSDHDTGSRSCSEFGTGTVRKKEQTQAERKQIQTWNEMKKQNN